MINSLEDFSYDPILGIFSHTATGKVYLPNTTNGYTCVRIGGELKYVHVLCFEMHTGKKVPDGLFVDHIDRDKSNIKFSNLRLATRGQNNTNRKTFSNNAIQQKGIVFERAKGLYRVRLSLLGKRYSGGRFKSLVDAIFARDRLMNKLHGEFSCK